MVDDRSVVRKKLAKIAGWVDARLHPVGLHMKNPWGQALSWVSFSWRFRRFLRRYRLQEGCRAMRGMSAEVSGSGSNRRLLQTSLR